MYVNAQVGRNVSQSHDAEGTEKKGWLRVTGAARSVGCPGHLEHLRLGPITTGSCRVHPCVVGSLGPRERSPGDLQLAVSTQAGAEAKRPGSEDHGGPPMGRWCQDMWECRWVPKGQCMLSK